MRKYIFKGVLYIGSGRLSFGLPSSNELCSGPIPIPLDSQFVKFHLLDDNLFVSIEVVAVSLRSALSLLSYTLSTVCLDLLINPSYVCLAANGKKSSRLLRSL